LTGLILPCLLAVVKRFLDEFQDLSILLISAILSSWGKFDSMLKVPGL